MVKIFNERLTDTWKKILRIQQLRINSRKHYYNNIESEKLRCNEYRQKNLKKYSKYSKKFRKKNPDYNKYQSKKFRKENKEKVRLWDKQRYKGLRKIKSIVDITNRLKNDKLLTVKLYQNILKDNNNKCHYCGSKKNIGLDHKKPRYLGGLSTKDNLTIACKSCNSKKGIKTYKEFTTNR